MVATYEDAGLLVQLMRLDAEIGVEDALAVIFDDSFDPESVDLGEPNARKVLYFGEAIGALVKHHVLDRDLVRDVYWFDGIWSRVKFYAFKTRELANEPALYENFELLVSPTS